MKLLTQRLHDKYQLVYPSLEWGMDNSHGVGAEQVNRAEMTEE